ncbi:MAG: hypothetical protein A2Y14_00340 [Verrucomicrobia bacterium GWF2_51_19]|nr:MAG: hypothetical protein A2Y14_00340 [Verrucomicrobia bacterium GWF2_51_19]HBA82835.1 hypothetical protein [Verrucomicrobiota bacterium]
MIPIKDEVQERAFVAEHDSSKFHGVTKSLTAVLLKQLFFIAIASLGYAQTPLPYTSNQTSPLSAQWEVFAAQNALQMGLPTVASQYFKEFLTHPNLSPEERRAYTLALVTAMIATQNFKTASFYLDSLPTQGNDPEYALRSAILAFYDGNRSQARRLLQKIPDSFSIADKPWYYVLQGLLVEGKNATEKASVFFEKALACTTSPEQKTEFEAVVARERIYSGTVDASLLASLEKKVKELKGTPSGAQFAKQYAIVLDKMGKNAEALSILDEQIALFQKDPEIDTLLFLKGLLAKSKSAFREILQRNANKKLMEESLLLFFQWSYQNNALDSLLETLDHVLINPDCKIREQALFISAQILVLQDKPAEKIIQQALSEFPGTREKIPFLKLLAYLSWRKTPPEYRNAAHFLLQIRSEKETSPADFSQLSVLIADCYFLNRDYSSARDFYSSALKGIHRPFNTSEVAYQWVLCSIQNQELSQALVDIETACSNQWLAQAQQWGLEWNLSLALKDNGQKDKAFERIRLSLANAKTMPIELALRFQWLEAQLLLDAHQPETAEQSALQLLSLLEKQTSLSEKEKKELLGYAIMIQAQSFFQRENFAQALAALQTLRERAPHTDSAVRSYLEAARYYASINDRVEAQQNLIALVDDYPNSHYAPIALYEAALNIELRGQSHFKTAFSVLDRLIKEYPQSAWVFLARLKQADLLRQLNNFSAAQQIYENLLQNCQHEERYSLELARAKCIMADENPNRKEIAAAEFERLFELSLAPIDLRVEAGFLWAYLTEQEGLPSAEKAYWNVIHTFLTAPTTPYAFESTGRYWLSRCLFQLGSLLSKQDKALEAKEAYALILKYELPGQNLAQARIQ